MELCLLEGGETRVPMLKGQRYFLPLDFVIPACSHFSLLRIMSSMVLIGTRRRNRCSPQICVAIILKCWLQEAGGRKRFIYTPRSQFVIEGN